MTLLTRAGTGDEQTNNGARYRLPVSIRTGGTRKWDARGYTGLKTGVGPIASHDVVIIVNTLLSELQNNLGVPLLIMAGLYGAKEPVAVAEKVVILAGASHMRRTADALRELGIVVKVVETAHWRATKREVQLLLENIREAIGDAKSDEVVLVLGMTDNAYYLARAEDGSLLPNCRSTDGSYHMHGEIVGSPLDSCRQVFLQLETLLKELQDFDKLLLVPLPRYLWMSCCSDPEHGPNVLEDDHADKMLAGTAAVQKLWRGMAFRSKIRNVKVSDVGAKVKEEVLWADPVHLTTNGYKLVAQHILGGLEAMEDKRRSAGDGDGGGDAKRRREDVGSGLTASKRAASTSGDYVTRQETGWRGGRGGYGGGGGGGGRGFRGGGGWGSWRGWPAGGYGTGFY
jgi:hypothetical protein